MQIEYTMLLQLKLVILLFQHQLQYFTCNSLSSNYSQYTDSQLSSPLPSDDFSESPFPHNSGLSYNTSLVYDESDSNDSAITFTSKLTTPLAPTEQLPDSVTSTSEATKPLASTEQLPDPGTSTSEVTAPLAPTKKLPDSVTSTSEASTPLPPTKKLPGSVTSTSEATPLAPTEQLPGSVTSTSEATPLAPTEQLYNSVTFTSEATTPLAPTEPPPCTYPTGSIACKTWNQTNLDCVQRSLTCIPQLPHAASGERLDLERNNIKGLPDFSFIRFQKLISLYLGFNKISFIGNHTFSGLGKLHLLDLASNKISFIGNHTFNGLYQLKHLDLQSNQLWSVSGSPFHDLNSLKTLHFWYGAKFYVDDSKPLITASFAGLTCLETLHLDIAYLSLFENVSFQESSMLDSLALTVKEDDNGDDVISIPLNVSGLFNLKTLRIYGKNNVKTQIDLCYLSALENLYLSGAGYNYFYVSNKCNTTNVKSFTVEWWTLAILGMDKLSGFEKLHNVTSITVTSLVEHGDVLFLIQALQMLNSPLEKLTIVYVSFLKPLPGEGNGIFDDVFFEVYQSAITSDNNIFNSTSFEPLALFNSSLHELSLNAEEYNLELEGSPFNHFHQLKKLTITCNSLSTGNAADVFEGLEHLQELQINSHDTSNIEIKLGQFTESLKCTTFSNMQVSYIPSIYFIREDWWCMFPFLEYLEVSYPYIEQFKCVLPHLQTINMREVKEIGTDASAYGNGINVCKVAPYLQRIDLSSTKFGVIPFIQQCPYLRVLNLSHAIGFHSPDVSSDMPLLEELYLSDIYDGTNLTFDVLRGFNMPKLRYLDISYNSISVITKDNAMLLSNMTYLDLTGNTLVFLDFVKYLVNIETLIVKANSLTTFPRELFTDSYNPFLNVFDLSDNHIVCDCGIQAFQSWIITDLRVHLLQTPMSDSKPRSRCSYCCASPDEREGLSITEIDLDCKSLLWAYIVIGVISAIFLVIIGLLVALYHWNIKNRLFLLLNRRRDPVAYLLDDDDHDDEDENGIPRYDAYVSYCNEDEDWICDELDPTIEGGVEPLRLCIRGRDIPANRPILQSISLYMKRSRKVMLILSPRYVDDRGRNQCKFELALAHQRLQEENEKVLILILLEEIPDRQMTLMLRQLFNRVLCLKWPGNECEQGLFWQRLREELKRRVPVDEHYEARDPQAIELQRMA